MSNFHNLFTEFAVCNLHLCLYGNLGLILVLQSVFALRQRQYYQAREQGVHGLIYLILGML